jgi:ketosteroid isomerase-like protein
MPQENLELVYRVIDAFNRRDLDAFLAIMDADVEFTPYEVWVQGGNPYRGHDGVRSWWQDSFAVLPDLTAEIYEVRDVGNTTFVSGRLRGHGAESGAAVERMMWLAVQFRDEKEVWWCSFGSEAEALDAAQLRE